MSNGQRITVLLPEDIVEQIEREAAEQHTTRHNYLADRIIKMSTTESKKTSDEVTKKLDQLLAWQRVSVSIIGKLWAEINPDAIADMKEMAKKAGAK